MSADDYILGPLSDNVEYKRNSDGTYSVTIKPFKKLTMSKEQLQSLIHSMPEISKAELKKLLEMQ